MAILGVGVDVVVVSAFAEQLARPGTVMLRNFTPGERNDVDRRQDTARHYAGRWAVKEAVVKAWSVSRFGRSPKEPNLSPREVEVVTDAWGRPQVRFGSVLASHLDEVRVHVSLSHDGDIAVAMAVLESDPAEELVES
ncbi:holo-acyl-carrier-protein synthase [Segniliparus rotundus DSM 44985]|uniref:Holo-[acyl-carrier-protein] synthase n=1 Tax=Segniliparus rotundus (strain ATCC BAA-972 / CDC 1076 / CIP 108378 / DSM 44985 / JCM 13578) TaxID=640132 RepID=D6ZBM4_SEGRD|nr:holo-ACP synthase [Segniliparus rotundus]ADG98976.1 holo-acyl-carrier-protein synthase [Segniliparus rotundus DSM 44985]